MLAGLGGWGEVHAPHETNKRAKEGAMKRRRAGLFLKYFAFIGLLVSAGLLASGAIGLYFSYEETRKIAEIEGNKDVSLTFTAPPSLLGKPGIFIAIEGIASLVRDKAAFVAVDPDLS